MTPLPEPLDRHPGTTHLLQTFEFARRLPEHTQRVGIACAELAAEVTAQLDDGPELTAGLRKLREAQDCFVLQAAIDHGRRLQRDTRAAILARLAGTPDVPDPADSDDPDRGARTGQPEGEG